MEVNRKSHSAEFKAKIALEAAKQEKTIAQLSGQFGVHANMITKWKKHMLQELPGVFSGMNKKANKDSESLIDELYRQIGQLKMEFCIFANAMTFFI